MYIDLNNVDIADFVENDWRIPNGGMSRNVASSIANERMLLRLDLRDN